MSDKIISVDVRLKQPKGTKRSPKWRKVRQAFLKKHPKCAVCDSKVRLQAHHIKPFHIRPDLELEESNLCVLCENAKYGISNDHLLFGHGGNFSDVNPDVEKDAKHFNELLTQWQTPKFEVKK